MTQIKDAVTELTVAAGKAVIVAGGVVVMFVFAHYAVIAGNVIAAHFGL